MLTGTRSHSVEILNSLWGGGWRSKYTGKPHEPGHGPASLASHPEKGQLFLLFPMAPCSGMHLPAGSYGTSLWVRTTVEWGRRGDGSHREGRWPPVAPGPEGTVRASRTTVFTQENVTSQSSGRHFS